MSISDVLTKHADTFRQKTGVTNKLSIHEMTNLMASLKWGQSNLLKGTSDQYKEVKVDVVYASSASNTDMHITDLANKQLAYSLTIINTTGTDIFAEIVQYDKDKNRISSRHSSNTSTEAGQECTFSVVDTISPQTANISCHLYIINAANKSVKIKDERLYVGTLPGVWTPSPYDLDGKIIINPNLATGTDDYSGNLWGSYSPNNVTDKFMGLTVKEVYGGGHIGPIVTVPDGDYTYSFFVKHNVSDSNSFNAKARPFDLDTMQEERNRDTVISGSLKGTDWQRVSFTFKNLKAGSYIFMAENWPGNWHDTVWVAGQKVESGDMLTGYLTKDNHLIDSSDLTGGS